MKRKICYAMLLMSLAACEKKYCWNCTVTAVATGGAGSTVKSSYTLCDKTTDEIKEVESAGQSSFSGNGITSRATTSCTKQ
jgi:hypothetical protein